MRVHDHLPLEELQRLAKAIAGKRLWKRYQAVILAIQGQDAKAIAQALDCSVRVVQVWIKTYNEQGPDALQEKP
jgi:transposase